MYLEMSYKKEFGTKLTLELWGWSAEAYFLTSHGHDHNQQRRCRIRAIFIVLLQTRGA